MMSWPNELLTKWTIGKMVSWQNYQDKMPNLWPEEGVSSWQNGKLTKSPVGTISNWQNDQLLKWLVDQMNSWSNEQLTKMANNSRCKNGSVDKMPN